MPQPNGSARRRQEGPRKFERSVRGFDLQHAEIDLHLVSAPVISGCQFPRKSGVGQTAKVRANREKALFSHIFNKAKE